MSKLTEQEIEAIRKEAEELYPTPYPFLTNKGEGVDPLWNFYDNKNIQAGCKREAHISAVTAERERAKELVEALESIKNAPVPYNDREYVSWVETARINSINALNQYNNGK